MSKQIACKLKAARATLDKTQREMAAAIGVPLRTYINWEQDVNTPRGLTREALNAKVDGLLKGKK